MPITPAPSTADAAVAPWDAPAITVRLGDGRRVSPECAGSIPLAHAMARATS